MQQSPLEKPLLGRSEPMRITEPHFVNGHSITPPFAENLHQILFGMGCFWGAERLFWQTKGVEITAVGYSGGTTPNANYQEVCTGNTGHTEVVLVVYNPQKISNQTLLALFWENHDPTQGMRQGNDIGTQYRSAIYTYNETQKKAAEQSKQAYQNQLTPAGFGTITTEIKTATPFYYAEPAHQQYLAKNPQGYCNLGGLNLT